MNQEQPNQLDIFIQQVNNLHGDFTLWSEMTHSEHKGKYADKPKFWWIIFRAVQDRVLLNLHEIFAENTRNETVNVWRILNQIQDGNKKTEAEEILCRKCVLKRRIKNWRDKLVAHKDEKEITKAAIELDDKYHITIGFLEDLIDDLYKFIEVASVTHKKDARLDNQKIREEFNAVLSSKQ